MKKKNFEEMDRQDMERIIRRIWKKVDVDQPIDVADLSVRICEAMGCDRTGNNFRISVNQTITGDGCTSTVLKVLVLLHDRLNDGWVTTITDRYFEENGFSF